MYLVNRTDSDSGQIDCLFNEATAFGIYCESGCFFVSFSVNDTLAFSENNFLTVEKQDVLSIILKNYVLSIYIGFL